jgi:hypothetical protein
MEVTRAFQSKYLEPSRAIGYFHNHPLEAFRNIHHHNLQQRGNSPPESNKNRKHTTVRMHCRQATQRLRCDSLAVKVNDRSNLKYRRIHRA